MKKLLLLFFLLLVGCKPEITGHVVNEYTKPTEIYFCPRDNCSVHLINFIDDSKESVHCAFYDIDLPDLIEALKEKSKDVDVRLVLDDRNYINLSFSRKDNKYRLSHNKFCVFDEGIVWTGSFNPTFRGNNKNNNNVVVIYSKRLARNYEDEFDELWQGVFGKGRETENSLFYINNAKIENYFCPEDWCANKVLAALNNASNSIYFMTFSFTHNQIGDMILKKHNQGLDVKGVFEKTQISRYSEYEKLSSFSKKDNNSYNMHHKVFIIDNRTVITGSFNPTLSADIKNDENLLIIENQEIADRFLEEFGVVYKHN